MRLSLRLAAALSCSWSSYHHAAAMVTVMTQV